MLSRSVMSESLLPPGQPGSAVLGDSPGKNWSGLPCPPPRHLPNPGIEPRCPALRAKSLPSEPLEKPMNTGMGSLFLLQGIFLTQESTWGLLHCGQILYHLSHQGSPLECVAYLGSLSLFQGIFPTQELNWGLLHCRWILYQLSYQGRPIHKIKYTN